MEDFSWKIYCSQNVLTLIENKNKKLIIFQDFQKIVFVHLQKLSQQKLKFNQSETFVVFNCAFNLQFHQGQS